MSVRAGDKHAELATGGSCISARVSRFESGLIRNSVFGQRRARHK